MFSKQASEYPIYSSQLSPQQSVFTPHRGVATWVNQHLYPVAVTTEITALVTEVEKHLEKFTSRLALRVLRVADIKMLELHPTVSQCFPAEQFPSDLKTVQNIRTWIDSTPRFLEILTDEVDVLLTLGYSDTLHVSERLVRQVAEKELTHRGWHDEERRLRRAKMNKYCTDWMEEYDLWDGFFPEHTHTHTHVCRPW